MKTGRKIIMITGGHVTPALAVIDEILSEQLPWDIVFVGRNKAFEGGSYFIQEQNAVEQKGIRFIPIATGRIQRAFTVHTITSLIKIPYGIIQAIFIIRKEKPDAVLSFGGYIAVPIAIAAAMAGIPVITHEQTRRPGLANRVISLLSTKICISFEDTKKFFPDAKTVYTGLPIRKEFFDTTLKNTLSVSYKTHPIIYITGGSTGSSSINAVIFPLVDRLITQYTVIHQTGIQSIEKAKVLKRSLPEAIRERYVIQDYFNADTASWIMQKATLVIGRAGANTVMELAILNRRAILIPLPWAGSDEQSDNAVWLTKRGSALILNQQSATSEKVYESIVQLLQKPDERRALQNLPRDGATQVVHLLQRIVD